MNWSSFWEQFGVSIHEKESLQDVFKLSYLRDTLKGDSAKQVIEGLSRTAGRIAMRDLSSFTRPINNCTILHAPPLKDGSATELRCLHDTLNQHLRVLKAIKHDLFDRFITGAAELKFNQLAMCEWQKFSREFESIPPYSDLLKFLDLEAKGAENTVEGSKCRHPVVMSSKKTISRPSYMVNINDTCVACKRDKI